MNDQLKSVSLFLMLQNVTVKRSQNAFHLFYELRKWIKIGISNNNDKNNDNNHNHNMYVCMFMYICIYYLAR